MCFGVGDDYEYKSRVEVHNGQQYYTEDYYPGMGMRRRRRYGFGGSYYPARYYAHPPSSRYSTGMIAHHGSAYSHAPVPRAFVRGYPGYASGYAYGTGYHVGARAIAPVNTAMPFSLPQQHHGHPHLHHSFSFQAHAIAMEQYPKPRHQYIYNPRIGQRGILTYAGQAPNGAAPAGVIGAGYGLGIGHPGVAAVAPGYAVGAYQSAVYNARPFLRYPYAANYYHPYLSGAYGCHNYNLYGSLYPLANFYFPSQRTYYNTVPSYGYTAHVYPPRPTTTTTTYHVTNNQVPAYVSPAASVVREIRPAYVHAYSSHVPTREDIQLENRRIATERGAYSPRRIRPADARDDDPFWCREVNGEWHLRSYYQIENECHPGRWMMDAEIGYLVFHRA